MLKKLLEALLDLLYPPRCMICQRFIEPKEKPVCRACLDRLPEHEGADPQVKYAQRCVATFFYEKDLREAFLRFKFQNRDHYADQFGKWMCATIRDKLEGRYDCITWAPVSRRRLRERGFDQSERLCMVIARELGLPVERLLQKTRHTKRQSELNDASMRAANASGAYSVVDPAKVAGRRILLIDDIVTTGATLAECSRVLRTAGAESVVCAVLAAARSDKER